MSRGLGSSQRLVLLALRALEDDAAADAYQGKFYVWAIVDQAYALSTGMQAKQQSQLARMEARNQHFRDLAEAGDKDALLYLSLTAGFGMRRRSPRRRRKSPWLSETSFNPSRVLALLEKRGLVIRHAIQGGGTAGLTSAGREIAASL